MTACIHRTRSSISHPSIRAPAAGRAFSLRSDRTTDDGRRRPTQFHAVRLWRWDREQACDRAPADVVDAGIDHALALDFNERRGPQVGAIKFAEREREIRALGIPGDHELRTELDLGGPVRTADRDPPAPADGRSFEPLGKLCAQ